MKKALVLILGQLCWTVLLLTFTFTSCDQIDELLTIEKPDNENRDEENQDNENHDEEDPDKNDPDDETDIEIEDKSLYDIILEKISSQNEQPVKLILSVELGIMSNPESNWNIILKAIEAGKKNVNLDLSSCTLENQTYKYFFPDFSIETGKNKIISLILPDTATDISGDSLKTAFKNFSNMEYIRGKGIEHIGAGAFYECIKLKEAEFPNVKDIMQSAFYGCINLLKADFPLVMMIDNGVFAECKNLLKADFPLAENIHNYAFANCTKLEEINLPNLKVFDNSVFSGCLNLIRVTLPKVTTIHEGAFRNFKNLTTIQLPNVTYIAKNAFENCINLIEADFPLVTSLEEYAFSGCTSLETAILPKIKFIYARTFFNCESLKNTDFSSVVHIADHAFYNCSSLEEVVFPKAMIIEPMSFGNCTSLTTARFLADPEPPKDADHKPIHPLYPWLNRLPGLPCVKESVLFYNEAFNGCTSLVTLDVRNAWNVYFVGNALNNIGETLEIYLYDDDGVLDDNGEIRSNYTGKSFGHPQLDSFLGAVSLKSIKIIAPNGTQIEKTLPSKDAYPGFYSDIKSRYAANNIDVTITRRTDLYNDQ